MPDVTGIREFRYIEPVLAEPGKLRPSVRAEGAESGDTVTYGQGDEVELSDLAKAYQAKIAGEKGKGDSLAENKQAADIKRASNEMAAREQEVIAHEMAHMATGGGLTGAVSYKYEMGPDGKRYISGGSVSIRISSGGDPEETIRKMQQVRRAAMAPSNPSGMDMAVAAQAAQIEAQARAELAKQNAAENAKDSEVKSLGQTKDHSNLNQRSLSRHNISFSV